MDELIKLIAKYLIVFPVLVNLYIFWKLNSANRKQMAVIAVAGGLLSLILAKVGGHFYQDIRPQFRDGATPLFGHSNNNGFPSDHTLLASFLGLLALGFSKKLGVAVLIAAGLIGWARVAAHVHHLNDILGSFIITAAAYLAVKYLVNKFYAPAAKSE